MINVGFGGDFLILAQHMPTFHFIVRCVAMNSFLPMHTIRNNHVFHMCLLFRGKDTTVFDSGYRTARVNELMRNEI